MCKCSKFSSLLKVSANVLIYRNKFFRTLSDSGTISNLSGSNTPTIYKLSIFKAQNSNRFKYSNLTENWYKLFCPFTISLKVQHLIKIFYPYKSLKHFIMPEFEKQIEIPLRETKHKMLGFKASPTEVKKLKTFCCSQNVSQSEFIRFAIRQYIPNF